MRTIAPSIVAPTVECGGTFGQDQIAAIIRKSDPRNLFAHETEAWQQAIDSALIWHMPPEFGVKAVALIERGICTLARRSYCRAPRPASLGSPRPLPERRRRERAPVT